MQFIFSPSWFALTDVSITAISAAVTLLLALYVFKIYIFTKETRHKFFSGAFVLLAAAFATSAATHFLSYYGLFERHAKGIAFYTFNILHSTTTFYAVGELAFRALTLAGLLTIFHVLERNANKKQIALTIFFAALATLFSITHYYVFYLTTFAIAALITYRFLFNYLEKPSSKTASLFVGFGIITLSQAVLILAALETVYVQASLLQLLGYIMLLATYLQIRK